MNVSAENLRNKLIEKGLKVTPQRISVLEAVYSLNNHPSAENIIEHIHLTHPNIATGTVYKVLDTLVENQILKKVMTNGDAMRYDGIIETHHHLYSSKDDLIEDYLDDELDELLQEYFKSKRLAGFKIEEIVLQIRGTFDNR